MDLFIISAPLVLQILMDLFPNSLSIHLLSYRSWWICFDHVLGIFFSFSLCFRNFGWDFWIFEICVHVVHVSESSNGKAKNYYYGDVSCRGSASPLHLEWTAHVNFYSWRYCLILKYPSIFVSLLVSLAQKPSTCITLSSILYLDGHLQKKLL